MVKRAGVRKKNSCQATAVFEWNRFNCLHKMVVIIACLTLSKPHGFENNSVFYKHAITAGDKASKHLL